MQFPFGQDRDPPHALSSPNPSASAPPGCRGGCARTAGTACCPSRVCPSSRGPEQLPPSPSEATPNCKGRTTPALVQKGCSNIRRCSPLSVTDRGESILGFENLCQALWGRMGRGVLAFRPCRTTGTRFLPGQQFRGRNFAFFKFNDQGPSGPAHEFPLGRLAAGVGVSVLRGLSAPRGRRQTPRDWLRCVTVEAPHLSRPGDKRDPL